MAKKSNYTMYIIIAIVVVIGLVLFIFKDSIFGGKKTVPVVVSIPAQAQVKAQAQVLAQVLDQAKAQVQTPVPEMAIKTMAEAKKETEKMIEELVNSCGGINVPITEECFKIAKSKIPRIKQLIKIALTFDDPFLNNLPKEKKEMIIKYVDYIDLFETQLNEKFYENYLKGKTINDIIQMVIKQAGLQGMYAA